MPFQALDSLIDNLSRHLHRLGEAELRDVRPRDFHALPRLFPVLGSLEAVLGASRPVTQPQDEQEQRRRAVAALRELLARLADRWPLVLFVDDLQWGDEDSAALLADLLKPPDPPLMLFVGAYRAEDADSSPFLHKLRQIRAQAESPWQQRELAVEPLSDEDSRTLTSTLLRRHGASLGQNLERVATESAGSPFFIRGLARYLSAGRLAGAPGDINLDQVLWSRIGRCAAEQLGEQEPGESRRLLHRARWAARRGLRLAWRFRNDLPHALRENALLAAERKQSRRAKSMFEESLRVADEQGARYEHALTLMAMGTAGLRFQWPDAEAQIASAQQAIRDTED